MADWQEGYVSDIDYTYGYYGELNPVRAQFSLALAGYAVSSVESACELGYGQGVSLNVHAAASPVRWCGTDFNPQQAAFAQQLALVAGTGRCSADEQGFEEFCHRQDLPALDFIGLHGIWSWISPENREHTLSLMRERLRPGGIVYVSYNTPPGWAAFAPIRAMLKLHADTMSASGLPVARRMDEAIQFIEQWMNTQPAYLAANPSIKQRIEKIKGMSRNYLVHEYFHDNWTLLPFHDAAKLLQGAKLSYACSASTLDSLAAIHLSEEQSKLLNGISDPIFRETVRDHCINQTFRRDYWVKGARRLSAREQAEVLRGLRVMLTVTPEALKYTVNGARGEATLQEPIYRPIVEALSDFKVQSIGQLEQRLAAQKIGLAQIAQAASVLVGNGSAHVAQADQAISIGRKGADAINRSLLMKAVYHEGMNYLASPVTGGGFAVSRISQLFLLARQQGAKTADDLARSAWLVLSQLNQRVIKDGKPLQTEAENLQSLTESSQAFISKELPILQGLAIA